MTLLLAVSLYAPHVAKLLAYADCSMQVMLANADARLCACNHIVYNADMPIGNQPEKQKELSVNADWKYTINELFLMEGFDGDYMQNEYPRYRSAALSQHFAAIFHPPRI